MTENQKRALHLLGSATGGRFDIWMLSGPARARLRAGIMSQLTGSKVPQAKAGVNAMRKAFHALGAITGTCHHDADENFFEWAKRQIAAGVPACASCGGLASMVNVYLIPLADGTGRHVCTHCRA